MGAASSRAISMTDVVTKTLTDIITENTTTCTNTTYSLQDMTFSDMKFKYCDVDFSNISQESNLNLNLSCAQDITNDTELQNKFANELSNKLDAALSGVTIGVADVSTEALTRIKTDITNNIKVSNVANFINENIIKQKMEFGKIESECAPGQKITFNNIRQKIVFDNVSKYIQESDTATQSINDAQNEIDNSLKSTLTGLSPLSSLASLFSSLIPVILLFLIGGKIGTQEGISSIIVVFVIVVMSGVGSIFV